MRLPDFTRTIRFRLTLWYSLLLLVFGLAFVVALNIAVRLDQPSANRSLEPIGDLALFRWVPVEEGAFAQSIEIQPVTLMQEVESEINQGHLDRVRNWSIIAVIGLLFASGGGGYLISGAMLRPVQRIQEVAKAISEDNLAERINYSGPDDELKRLADTFDGMLDRLQASFERQRQFVADASHELRTPLTVIQTNIDVTQMEEQPSLDEYERLTGVVKDATARMARLSDDLLLLTGGSLDQRLEPVNVNSQVDRVVATLRPVAALRSISLHVEPLASRIPPRALAHESRLERAITNLVENAIKYGREGGNVWVRTRASDGKVHVDVADDGPGIALDQQQHVFERFYRVEKSRSRAAGGSGLGLAIVRQVVEEMGGTVGLDSLPGKGATFTISLPVFQPERRQRFERPPLASPEAEMAT